MLYFKHFPTTSIDVQEKTIGMTDISVRFKMLDYLKTKGDFFSSSSILKYLMDEQVTRPEEISFELYGSYDYTWTILLLNNVYNFYEDWVLPEDVFEEMVIKKYGSLDNAKNTFLYYVDEYGYEVSATDKNVIKSISIYEELYNKNQEKKVIDVFEPSIIRNVQSDFERLIR